MANRRMVHRKVSLNQDLAQLPAFTCLLFTWGIIHADDWGVLPGDPNVVRGMVFPLRRESTNQVAKALDDLVEHRLLVRWNEEGRTYLCYPAFEKYQDGLHRRTRTRAELPLPPGHPERITEGSEKFREVPGNNGLARARRTDVDVDSDVDVDRDREVEPAASPPAPPLAPSGLGMKRPDAPMLLANHPSLSQAVREVYGNHWSQAQQNDFTVDAAAALEEPGCKVDEQDACTALRGNEKPDPDERGDWWVGRLSKKRRRESEGQGIASSHVAFVRACDGYSNPTDETWLTFARLYETNPTSPDVVGYIRDAQARQKQKKGKRLEVEA